MALRVATPRTHGGGDPMGGYPAHTRVATLRVATLHASLVLGADGLTDARVRDKRSWRTSMLSHGASEGARETRARGHPSQDACARVRATVVHESTQ